MASRGIDFFMLPYHPINRGDQCMAIQYDFYETSELQDEDDEGRLRARAVSRGTISAEKLWKRVEQVSGFSVAQTKGVMEAVAEMTQYFLGEGYSVQLGELGYLSVSLTSRRVKNCKEIRAESVEFSQLNFRASKKVRGFLIYTEKEKVSKKRSQSSKLPIEKRAQLLKDFLSTHPFASGVDYCRMTATLKGKAMRDLHSFIEEGWLRKYGNGRTVVYLLNEKG